LRPASYLLVIVRGATQFLPRRLALNSSEPIPGIPSKPITGSIPLALLLCGHPKRITSATHNADHVFAIQHGPIYAMEFDAPT